MKSRPSTSHPRTTPVNVRSDNDNRPATGTNAPIPSPTSVSHRQGRAGERQSSKGQSEMQKNEREDNSTTRHNAPMNKAFVKHQKRGNKDQKSTSHTSELLEVDKKKMEDESIEVTLGKPDQRGKRVSINIKDKPTHVTVSQLQNRANESEVELRSGHTPSTVSQAGILLKSKLDKVTKFNSFITDHLLKPQVVSTDSIPTLQTAREYQLEGALSKLESFFRDYIKDIEGEDLTNNSEYQQIKRELADTANIRRCHPMNGNEHLKMMLALNELHAKITLELNTLDNTRRNAPGEGEILIAPLSEKKKLAFALDLKPHDKEELAKKLSKAGFSDVQGIDVPSKDRSIVLSEQYPNLTRGTSDIPPLNEANPRQLNQAFKRLNQRFSRYSKYLKTIQEEGAKQKRYRDSIKLNTAQNEVHKLEKLLNSNRTQSKQEDPIGMLQAMTIMRGRMAFELERLQKDSTYTDLASIAACESELDKLTKALQEPEFEFDRYELESTLGNLGLRPVSPEINTPEDLLLKLTETYRGFETDYLLSGTPLEEANEGELNEAFNKFNRLFNAYCYTLKEFEEEESKPNPPILGHYEQAEYKNKTLMRELTKLKHDLQERAGISKAEGRQEFLRAFNLIFARINQALEALPSPGALSESSSVVPIDFNRGELINKLVKPPFKHDAKQLREDLQLPFEEFGIPFRRDLSGKEMAERFADLSRKQAVMETYVNDTLHTIDLFSQAHNPNSVRKPWQSKKLDERVNTLRIQLAELKRNLPQQPSNQSIVNMGVESNRLFEQFYHDIAEIAEERIKHTNNSEKAKALADLRDTAHLAEQHHCSSRQVGLITSVKVAFEKLPRHILERIATAPAPGVDVSSSTGLTLGGAEEVGIPGFGSLRIAAEINPNHSHTMSVARANDGNLFGKNTTKRSLVNFSLSASAGKTDSWIKDNENLAEAELPKGASINARASRSKQGGTVALAATTGAMLGALHAPSLSEGKAIGTTEGKLARWTGIGGSAGRFSGLSGIDDFFGNHALAGITEASLKLGYNNDQEITEGFRRLLGNDADVVYDHQGRPPLGKLFASPELKSRETTIDPDKGITSVMSEVFPDPNWGSLEYRSTSTRVSGSAEGSLGFKKQAGDELQGRFFTDHEPGHAQEAVYRLFGGRIGGSFTREWSTTGRVVRSPKLPHDIFDPVNSQSPRLSTQWARAYFTEPSIAVRASSQAIAKDLGFRHVDDYFATMQGSIGHPDPDLHISQQQREKLTERYNQFQQDINLIDNFYLQHNKSIRQKKMAEVQAAINRINRDYGAVLPLPNDRNIGKFHVNKMLGGYTEDYRQFQDTAVAILGSFSAAAGAMKLMGEHHATELDKVRSLTRAGKDLLAQMHRRAMPWNKLEMAGRSAYVRQIVAENFSSSVSTTITGEAAINHTLKGGDYDFRLIASPESDDDSNDDSTDGAGDEAERILGGLVQEPSTGLGPKHILSKVVADLPDNVTDPGQTGRTVWTTLTRRQVIRKPFRDLRKQNSIGGVTRQVLLNILAYKKEVEYTQVQEKKQAYTAHEDDDPATARKFTAYRSKTKREETGVSARLGFPIPGVENIPVPGLRNISANLRQSEEKNSYELEHYTYGNDVGAMSIIMTKLFADNNIILEGLKSNDTRLKTFFDDLDPRFADALLSDKQYDHISAILSKFRNSGYSIEETDGKLSVKVPEVDYETGMVKEDSVAVGFNNGSLNNSKGQPIYLSESDPDLDVVPPKKYVDRSGFFGYAAARYDHNIIQDAFKHWEGNYQTEFPDAFEINTSLASIDNNIHPGKTRQQWLKSISKQKRKEFYQGTTEGREMLLNYLKVMAFAAAINDTVFQTNTYQIEIDRKHNSRIENFFKNPTTKKDGSRKGSRKTDAAKRSGISRKASKEPDRTKAKQQTTATGNAPRHISSSTPQTRTPDNTPGHHTSAELRTRVQTYKISSSSGDITRHINEDTVIVNAANQDLLSSSDQGTAGAIRDWASQHAPELYAQVGKYQKLSVGSVALTNFNDEQGTPLLIAHAVNTSRTKGVSNIIPGSKDDKRSIKQLVKKTLESIQRNNLTQSKPRSTVVFPILGGGVNASQAQDKDQYQLGIVKEMLQGIREYRQSTKGNSQGAPTTISINGFNASENNIIRQALREYKEQNQQASLKGEKQKSATQRPRPSSRQHAEIGPQRVESQARRSLPSWYPSPDEEKEEIK